METFYRYMRKKHHVLLVDGDKPLNGKWNFDEDNRRKLPAKHKPVSDNETLVRAIKQSDEIIPVYCFDKPILKLPNWV